ncbi:hypothetical protein [Trueperella pyogenes]|uniref:hypothetical protein n=1 Tax=Trueperella pyogenes TaxID=1661 RepID=UPI00345CD7C2
MASMAGFVFTPPPLFLSFTGPPFNNRWLTYWYYIARRADSYPPACYFKRYRAARLPGQPGSHPSYIGIGESFDNLIGERIDHLDIRVSDF